MVETFRAAVAGTAHEVVGDLLHPPLQCAAERFQGFQAGAACLGDPGLKTRDRRGRPADTPVLATNLDENFVRPIQHMARQSIDVRSVLGGVAWFGTVGDRIAPDDSHDGTYWGIRTDIANYGLADVLNCPHAQTLQIAETPTRLSRVDETL